MSPRKLLTEAQKERQRVRAKRWRLANPERARFLTERWQAKHPEKKHGHHIRCRYGMTLAQQDALIRQQGGRCAICLDPLPALTKGMHVDHDHATGKVRGLLCQSCNHGLGMFRDDVLRLSNAIDYLELTRLL